MGPLNEDESVSNASTLNKTRNKAEENGRHAIASVGAECKDVSLSPSDHASCSSHSSAKKSKPLGDDTTGSVESKIRVINESGEGFIDANDLSHFIQQLQVAMPEAAVIDVTPREYFIEDVLEDEQKYQKEFEKKQTKEKTKVKTKGKHTKNAKTKNTGKAKEKKTIKNDEGFKHPAMLAKSDGQPNVKTLENHYQIVIPVVETTVKNREQGRLDFGTDEASMKNLEERLTEVTLSRKPSFDINPILEKLLNGSELYRKDIEVSFNFSKAVMADRFNRGKTKFYDFNSAVNFIFHNKDFFERLVSVVRYDSLLAMQRSENALNELSEEDILFHARRFKYCLDDEIDGRGFVGETTMRVLLRLQSMIDKSRVSSGMPIYCDTRQENEVTNFVKAMTYWLQNMSADIALENSTPTDDLKYLKSRMEEEMEDYCLQNVKAARRLTAQGKLSLAVSLYNDAAFAAIVRKRNELSVNILGKYNTLLKNPEDSGEDDENHYFTSEDSEEIDPYVDYYDDEMFEDAPVGEDNTGSASKTEKKDCLNEKEESKKDDFVNSKNRSDSKNNKDPNKAPVSTSSNDSKKDSKAYHKRSQEAFESCKDGINEDLEIEDLEDDVFINEELHEVPKRDSKVFGKSASKEDPTSDVPENQVNEFSENGASKGPMIAVSESISHEAECKSPKVKVLQTEHINKFPESQVSVEVFESHYRHEEATKNEVRIVEKAASEEMSEKVSLKAPKNEIPKTKYSESDVAINDSQNEVEMVDVHKKEIPKSNSLGSDISNIEIPEKNSSCKEESLLQGFEHEVITKIEVNTIDDFGEEPKNRDAIEKNGDDGKIEDVKNDLNQTQNETEQVDANEKNSNFLKNSIFGSVDSFSANDDAFVIPCEHESIWLEVMCQKLECLVMDQKHRRGSNCAINLLDWMTTYKTAMNSTELAAQYPQRYLCILSCFISCECQAGTFKSTMSGINYAIEKFLNLVPSTGIERSLFELRDKIFIIRHEFYDATRYVTQKERYEYPLAKQEVADDRESAKIIVDLSEKKKATVLTGNQLLVNDFSVALKIAKDGDTIFLNHGIYNFAPARSIGEDVQYIVFNKSLNIIGCHTSSVILCGSIYKSSEKCLNFKRLTLSLGETASNIPYGFFHCGGVVTFNDCFINSNQRKLIGICGKSSPDDTTPLLMSLKDTYVVGSDGIFITLMGPVGSVYMETCYVSRLFHVITTVGLEKREGDVTLNNCIFACVQNGIMMYVHHESKCTLNIKGCNFRLEPIREDVPTIGICQTGGAASIKQNIILLGHSINWETGISLHSMKDAQISTNRIESSEDENRKWFISTGIMLSEIQTSKVEKNELVGLRIGIKITNKLRDVRSEIEITGCCLTHNSVGLSIDEDHMGGELRYNERELKVKGKKTESPEEESKSPKEPKHIRKDDNHIREMCQAETNLYIKLNNTYFQTCYYGLMNQSGKTRLLVEVCAFHNVPKALIVNFRNVGVATKLGKKNEYNFTRSFKSAQKEAEATGSKRHAKAFVDMVNLSIDTTENLPSRVHYAKTDYHILTFQSDEAMYKSLYQ